MYPKRIIFAKEIKINRLSDRAVILLESVPDIIPRHNTEPPGF